MEAWRVLPYKDVFPSANEVFCHVDSDLVRTPVNYLEKNLEINISFFFCIALSWFEVIEKWAFQLEFWLVLLYE